MGFLGFLGMLQELVGHRLSYGAMISGPAVKTTGLMESVGKFIVPMRLDLFEGLKSTGGFWLLLLGVLSLVILGAIILALRVQSSSWTRISILGIYAFSLLHQFGLVALCLGVLLLSGYQGVRFLKSRIFITALVATIVHLVFWSIFGFLQRDWFLLYAAGSDGSQVSLVTPPKLIESPTTTLFCTFKLPPE